MQGLTQYITDEIWADILLVSFVYIDDAYGRLSAGQQPRRRAGVVWEPLFSDSEVITITLFGEMVFQGAEDKTLHYIRQHHAALFPHLLDNSRFNRRKRQLTYTMEAIRTDLRAQWRQAHPLDEAECAIRIVDSAPIPICTYTRARRCETIPPEQRAEWFGVCASKKQKFFGARCHLLTDLDQMIDTWVLAPASYEDRAPLSSLLAEQRGILIMGDKGYVSADLEERLWQQGDHLLLALKRTNQKVQWPSAIQAIIGSLRHRVETVFSVLSSVFTLDRPRSRSFTGLVARTTAKILAHTLSFFLAEFFSPLSSN